MEKQHYENSNQTTFLRLTTWADIAQILTILFIIGAVVGLVIGLIRGSWVEVLIFSSSIPPILAFLGLLVMFVVNVISSLFASKKRNNERHDRLFIPWGLTIVVDGIFLIIWVTIQWALALLIGYIELTWIDQWMLNILQVLFAIMTLIPIIAYICVHTIENFVQTRLRIRNELKKLEYH